MATIDVQSGSLQALLTLRRDKISSDYVLDKTTRQAKIEYSHDVFNALLALGNESANVRFVVDCLSVEDDVAAVLLAADWTLNTTDMCYHNPKWVPTKFQLQAKVAGKIEYLTLPAADIDGVLASPSYEVRRMFMPTRVLRRKYHLEKTEVEGVYNFPVKP